MLDLNRKNPSLQKGLSQGDGRAPNFDEIEPPRWIDVVLILAVMALYLAAPYLLLLSVGAGDFDYEMRRALGPLADQSMLLLLGFLAALLSINSLNILDHFGSLDRDSGLYDALKRLWFLLFMVKGFICFLGTFFMGIPGILVLGFALSDGLDAESASLAAFLLYPALWALAHKVIDHETFQKK